MNKIIHIFDLYGKNVPLYTKSSTKATTCIGFVFTIISFLLFGFILYTECYEVIKREYPNVVSYKQAKNKINTTLSNNTFNFFINIGSDYETDNFLNYFEISSSLQFDNNNNNNNLSVIEIPYEKCNANDKTNFRNYFENFEFPEFGTSLCPRMDYDYLENFKEFGQFDFYYIISECSGKVSSCTKNDTLYKRIRDGNSTIMAKLCYLNNEMDLTNDENPYWFNFKEFYGLTGWMDEIVIELEGSEIYSKSLFSFNAPSVKSRLSYSRSYATQKLAKEFLSFNIRFYSNDMFIYIRTYKTFNTAVAISFALFKLIHKLISILLGPVYKYYMNNIIINNNFSYEVSTLSTGVANNIEVSTERGISTELISVRLKKLTTISALKNVSLFRYVICRRRNKTKTFYDQAKLVIYKNLSVENLLQFLIEYYRLKKFLCDKVDISENEFSSSRHKLILNGKVKDPEKLRLEELLHCNNFIVDDIK
jgi:hypothetical protein